MQHTDGHCERLLRLPDSFRALAQLKQLSECHPSLSHTHALTRKPVQSLTSSLTHQPAIHLHQTYPSTHKSNPCLFLLVSPSIFRRWEVMYNVISLSIWCSVLSFMFLGSVKSRVGKVLDV